MNLQAAKECWMQTFTGRKFYPLNPRPEDVCIEDIAHALSLFNRFGGHTQESYSVGAHSLHVSELCELDKMGGLMHDATEAYMGDMIRPLKYCFPDFKRYEERLWNAIADGLGISRELHREVKAADNLALITERAHLWHCKPVDSWGPELESLTPGPLPPYTGFSPRAVERFFLDRFYALKPLQTV